MNLIVDGLL